MGDSSPDEQFGTDNWVFYRDRPEWKDVKPLPQDDGPFPVVAIAYSDKFRDVYDYFRAVLKSNEKSERALQLTVDALLLNPANYTVWQFRRDVLRHLNKDLNEELKYVKEVIDEHPKNYQVWHHRRVIVEWLGEPGVELEVTEAVLESDDKNYHAWQHRQWVIHTFGRFANELEYVDSLIAQDIRNNSAWNQRYFVLNHTTNFLPDILKREIAYTLDKIELVTKNESPWNYLRGILLHSENGLNEPSVTKFCEDLYASGNRSPYLLAYLVDAALEKIESSVDNNSKLENSVENQQELAEKAVKLCKDLAEEYDRIRVEYWKYVARGFQKYLQQ